jgi:hypothetical protein
MIVIISSPGALAIDLLFTLAFPLSDPETEIGIEPVKIPRT